MKLRILDDTVRLRLTRSEVATLATVGTVTAVSDLGGKAFRYRVETADALGVAWDGAELVVAVPAGEVTAWSPDDGQTGIGGTVGATTVAVEKDFRCLIPRAGVDPEDHYPNPKEPRGIA